MTPTSTPSPEIPCKVPKTVAEYDGDGLHLHRCLVPGCGWTYRSVKTAEEVRWHKQAHRDAVPKTTVTPTGPGAEVEAECGCGENWVSPTKAHARTWIRHHLELDHGLVVCP